MSLTDEEIERALRVGRFLDSRDFGLITEEDIDWLAEHWKLSIRLHNLDLSDLNA